MGLHFFKTNLLNCAFLRNVSGKDEEKYTTALFLILYLQIILQCFLCALTKLIVPLQVLAT